MATITHTRTHVHERYANPYLVCLVCGEPVAASHTDTACGCTSGSWNVPCGHPVGITSLCPSWSPVDGCQCAQQIGSVDHPVVPN